MTKRGHDPEKLTDKQRMFVAEYLVDRNGTRAAIAAGYSEKVAKVQASKLLKHPLVRRIIGKMESDTLEVKGLERRDVLQKISDSLHRDYNDLEGADGFVVTRMKDIPPRAFAWINGFEVKQFFDQDGNIERQEIKIRVSPNESAQDMAMKHVGAYAAEKHEVNQTINFAPEVWEQLRSAKVRDDYDLIEQRLQQEANMADRKERHKQMAIEAEYTVQELLDEEQPDE